MTFATPPGRNAAKTAKPQSLRRELMAIAFLYVGLSVLPLLIGLLLAA